MPHGWERAHVGSDLSDHGLGGGRTKPRHLLQPLDDVMKGRQRGLNAGVEGCNAVLQLLNRPQMLTEQEPMMLPDTAGENFHQLSPRAAEALMAKRGELFGIRLACDHGLQHAPPAGAHDVRDHRTQLDVRLLQNRLDTLHVPHYLARQLPARSG